MSLSSFLKGFPSFISFNAIIYKFEDVISSEKKVSDDFAFSSY